MMMKSSEKLRHLLAENRCHPMPCCWDALTAKMIGQAGFRFTFMSGFAVAASRIGEPDLGLISYGEMLDQGRNVCAAVDIPVIGDGDTGYGNALNVERTVRGYHQAGFASIMIEDQLAPKRCGHTKGKMVVDREEALDRVRAAVHARDNLDGDILILARTDARAIHGLNEAVWRAQKFAEIGADILFVEAPENKDEMAIITCEAPGVHMANLVEGGTTPMQPMDRLHELGYRFAAFPLTLLSAAMRAVGDSLAVMARGGHPGDKLLDFSDLRRIVGFDDYYEDEQRYASVAR